MYTCAHGPRGTGMVAGVLVLRITLDLITAHWAVTWPARIRPVAGRGHLPNVELIFPISPITERRGARFATREMKNSGRKGNEEENKGNRHRARARGRYEIMGFDGRL